MNDNASGSIALLEIAYRLMDYQQPLNNIKLCFWGAEELGLWGSFAHVRNLAPSTRKRVMAYLNFDMIASSNFVYGVYSAKGELVNPPDSRESNPHGSEDITALFEEFFDRYGYNHTRFYTDGRSDYGPFKDMNIPIGGLFTGGSEIKNEEQVALFGGEAGRPYDPNYHTVNDTLANMNMMALEVNTRAISYVTAMLAMDGADAVGEQRLKVQRPNPSHLEDTQIYRLIESMSKEMGYTTKQALDAFNRTLNGFEPANKTRSKYA
jgi:Zn-dependent M28 family amino/carboxypeptidase